MRHCALHLTTRSHSRSTTSITVSERRNEEVHRNRYEIVLFRCAKRKETREAIMFGKKILCISWSVVAAHIVLRPFSSTMNAKETLADRRSPIFGLQRPVRCIMSIIIYTTNTIYYYYFCTYFKSSSVCGIRIRAHMHSQRGEQSTCKVSVSRVRSTPSR